MAKKKAASQKTKTLVRRGDAIPVAKIATEIRELIEATRSHVSMTANLAMVNLYWNIGRIIAQDIQRNEKRAAYGTELMEQLAVVLARDYGQGYSVNNLRDMKRFFDAFVIRQPAAAESAVHSICSTGSNESQIPQTVSGESSPRAICQPLAGKSPSDQILQTLSGESSLRTILQPLANKPLSNQILQTPSAESCERLLVDFRRHFRLGWSHYRLLLGQSNPLCRDFYFEQAAEQRWSVRELRRQIDRGLFERVALSKDTPRLVAQEKRGGPAEVVCYEDIFKDPYVPDFLGLKGAYAEKDLETAIVRNLEQFLTELGTGFCFVLASKAKQSSIRRVEIASSLKLLAMTYPGSFC
ncbi:MAG: DUF1016 domain-containing protein [Planctomycetes bacterium]|nr:DUF1016 domain-containing protein [Planctomycetota bacterium]